MTESDSIIIMSLVIDSDGIIYILLVIESDGTITIALELLENTSSSYPAEGVMKFGFLSALLSYGIEMVRLRLILPRLATSENEA